MTYSETHCTVCGALSYDPIKCSYCGSSIDSESNAPIGIASTRRYTSKRLKQKAISSTESHTLPGTYFNRKEQRLREKVISRASRVLGKNEKVEYVFMSDFRLSDRFRRLTLLSTTLVLISYFIGEVLIPVPPGDVPVILLMAIISSLVPVFLPLVIWLLSHFLLGFDPRKLAFAATGERIMIFSQRGRYVSSIWIRQMASLGVVSSASRGGESASIIFPLPFAADKPPELGHHRFVGPYVGEMRKILGKKISYEFWKENIAFVDGRSLTNIISYIQSHSPTPVHVFNYRAGKENKLPQESTPAYFQ